MIRLLTRALNTIEALKPGFLLDLLHLIKLTLTRLEENCADFEDTRCLVQLISEEFEFQEDSDDPEEQELARVMVETLATY